MEHILHFCVKHSSFIAVGRIFVVNLSKESFYQTAKLFIYVRRTLYVCDMPSRYSTISFASARLSSSSSSDHIKESVRKMAENVVWTYLRLATRRNSRRNRTLYALPLYSLYLVNCVMVQHTHTHTHHFPRRKCFAHTHSPYAIILGLPTIRRLALGTCVTFTYSHTTLMHKPTPALSQKLGTPKSQAHAGTKCFAFCPVADEGYGLGLYCV